jgi:GNAT superfamily N-acetyltransferase
MRFPDHLRAAGFVRLDPSHPRSLDNAATWERDQLRMVIRQETLGMSNGAVIRYDADGKEMTLSKLFVAPEARRSGVATACLTDLSSIADKTGFAFYIEPVPFEKSVGNDALTAQALSKFYKRFGFTSIGSKDRILMRPPKIEPELRQGVIGDMLAPGESVRTSSGRATSPFPSFKKITSKIVRDIDAWLISNAAEEARSRNDDFNLRIFEGIKKPSPADKDAAEMYLFGEQPPVVRSILKPLTSPSL